jgi:replicative DNA helicase
MERLKIFSTGFSELDQQIKGGFHLGTLSVIASRPGMGKSSFLLSTLASQIEKTNPIIVLFSLEMSSSMIKLSLVAQLAGVEFRKVRKGELSPKEKSAVDKAQLKMEQAKIFIDDRSGLRPEDMQKELERICSQEGQIDLVAIDYIQLMGVDSDCSRSIKSGSRLEQSFWIAERLKDLAVKLNVPVIALSQLSGIVDKRGDHRPQQEDLNYSFAGGQVSDLIIFPYRESYYSSQKSEAEIMEIIVAKQKDGVTGVIHRPWNSQKGQLN